jgi:CcmD family protein
MDPLAWVLIASLLVWGGLFCYLVYAEGRVSRLEKRLEREEQR